jgi:predicted alpha/beta-fold hydrolase
MTLRAVAAVCPPLDLSACADALETPGGRFYTWYFMDNLRQAYGRQQRRHPQLYEAGRERDTRTVRAFDEQITALYGGYRDAEDYYARSSAGPWLAKVERPALILAAADDPMVPAASVMRFALPASGLVEREVQPTGGHVGFMARTAAPGYFWAAERVLDWLGPKVA